MSISYKFPPLKKGSSTDRSNIYYIKSPILHLNTNIKYIIQNYFTLLDFLCLRSVSKRYSEITNNFICFNCNEGKSNYGEINEDIIDKAISKSIPIRTSIRGKAL